MAIRAMALQAREEAFPSRFAQLIGGLVLYGFALALEVRAGLGLAPWDVLNQGLARQTHMQIGTWSVLVGLLVLPLWIPLRQRPGIGTICNAVLIGSTINAVLLFAPTPEGLPARLLFLAAGVLLSGVATGAYIGAGLGPGPRDGLMMGIAARGHSIGVVRTILEVVVLVVGFALGGTVGVGTVAHALGIGPIAHITVPLMRRQAGLRQPSAR